MNAVVKRGKLLSEHYLARVKAENGAKVAFIYLFTRSDRDKENPALLKSLRKPNGPIFKFSTVLR